MSWMKDNCIGRVAILWYFCYESCAMLPCRMPACFESTRLLRKGELNDLDELKEIAMLQKPTAYALFGKLQLTQFFLIEEFSRKFALTLLTYMLAHVCKAMLK